MRYEVTDHEWPAINPMLPNKPRGVARVLNGIFCVSRSGAPWRNPPDSFGPHGTAAGGSSVLPHSHILAQDRQCFRSYLV
jgi:transposase